MSQKEVFARLNDIAQKEQESAPAKTASQERADRIRRTGTGGLADIANMGLDARELAKERARIEALKGQPIELELSKLRWSSYQQQGDLDESRVERLVEALKVSPLATPILVRLANDGMYEIVAGRHRTEAFRRLGRLSIPATLKELTENEAKLVVLGDNYFRPDPSDFETYLDFCMARGNEKISQETLALRTGVAKSQIQRIMSFDHLPAESIAALHASKSKKNVGANLVAQIGKHSEQYPELVTLVLTKVLDGVLQQGAAVKRLEDEISTKELGAGTRPRAEGSHKPFQRNGKPFASLGQSGKKLVVTVANKADMDRLEAAIAKALSDLAAASE